jgi:hypothetical protein
MIVPTTVASTPCLLIAAERGVLEAVEALVVAGEAVVVDRL